MARSIRNGLESRSARLKLPVSSKPNWITIGPGLGLGYRRNKTAGNWVARIADGKSGYSTRNIGIADDYAEANDAEILNYFQAQAKARQLVDGSAVQASFTTVNEALKQYAADIRTRGGDVGNASRLRGHLSPATLRSRSRCCRLPSFAAGATASSRTCCVDSQSHQHGVRGGAEPCCRSG
jgi:hypothetical protein